MISNLKEKFFHRSKNEFEIYILMIIFAVWYLLNIGGAIKQDEPIYAFQGYYFVKGIVSGNIPLDPLQNRPLGRYFFGLGQVLFGRTTFGAKFFVFLFGIFTIYLTYLITKALCNKRINGFFAALIVGIIPLFGDLSVSALLDIMLTFFGVLLLYIAIGFLRTKDIIRKQRLIFLMGVLSICTLASKLYGASFSLVVFIFLLGVEWKTIKTIKLFKRKNILKRLKKNIFLMPIFAVLGALFGLLIRSQLSDLWESAGEKGKADVLELLPNFLDDIVMDMNGGQAYLFCISLGIILFIIFWLICSLVGRESLRTLKCLAKKKALDEKYHVLIYIIGAIVGFVVIFLPNLFNPVHMFTHLLLGQPIHLKQGAPKVVGGVAYETAPWWSYFYWTYVHLGLMFVIGLIISLLYTAFRFLNKESVTREMNLLFLYTFIPFVLLSSLSVKSPIYFVILFPLFSIYMVVQVAALVERFGSSMPIEPIKIHAKWLSISAIVVLMLLPGPLWMTLYDPYLGHDSGYDVAGELVVDYADENPGQDLRIIAFDTLALEFYLPDRMLENVEIIPLFSDNYSIDIIGRPYIYYPEDELYGMVLSNDIDMLVDEPDRYPNKDSLIRRYATENSTAITQINDELFVYYLKV